MRYRRLQQLSLRLAPDSLAVCPKRKHGLRDGVWTQA
jgi:hypothetical protein